MTAHFAKPEIWPIKLRKHGVVCRTTFKQILYLAVAGELQIFLLGLIVTVKLLVLCNQYRGLTSIKGV